MIDLTRNKLWPLVLMPLLAVNLGLVAASVVRHTRSNQHDQVAHVDSTVELSCDLSYEYRDDLEWRKLNGVSRHKARRKLHATWLDFGFQVFFFIIRDKAPILAWSMANSLSLGSLTKMLASTNVSPTTASPVWSS